MAAIPIHLYAGLTCFHSVLAVVAVGTGLHEPRLWPGPCGRWKDAYTIRRFWEYIESRIACQLSIDSSIWYLPAGLGIRPHFFFVSGVTFIYINSAALNRASVGATIDLAQLLVFIMSAVGPSAISSGIQKHVMGGLFAYWVMAGMRQPLL